MTTQAEIMKTQNYVTRYIPALSSIAKFTCKILCKLMLNIVQGATNKKTALKESRK